jgi:hypothetical protein
MIYRARAKIPKRKLAILTRPSYLYSSTRKILGKALLRLPSPTMFGYGYSEEPRNGEYDQIRECEEKGYWQYSLMNKFVFDNKSYQFDEQANKDLIRQIVKDKRTGKIFLEPHLKKRLGFGKNNKVRYHGCKAVRHDDHIHIQL